MSKVYDCCMVFDEIDMLELRMNILAPYVDTFVVVESGMTHSGKIKGAPVGDALQTARFDRFSDKIVYAYVAALEGTNAWERERNQRGLIGGVLQAFAAPDDFVIVSDCDEIVSPEAVALVSQVYHAAKFELEMFYYDFNHRVREGWAVGGCRWSVLQDTNRIRQCDFGFTPQTIRPAGHHLSYFGDAAAIMRKAKAFMHADWVDVYELTEAKVQAALDAGVDLWGRTLQIDYLPRNFELPRYVLEHRAKYEALGWLERQAEATWQS